MIAAENLLKKLVTDQQSRDQAREDAEAAQAREELKTFDRHPPALRKAQAHVVALKAKVARAEADLAVAKANYHEAYAEENRLAQRWSYDLQQLRMRARNQSRLRPALERLHAHIDEVRRVTPFIWRRAHDLLIESMHTLGGMDSGATDPIENYEAFVDDAIARAEEALAEARREHLKRQEQEDKKKRVEKILS